MNVEILAVCEYAQAIGQSLNIMTPFDSIITNKLPVPRSFHVALRIRFDSKELRQHDIEYKFITPQGKNLLQDLRASVDINQPDPKTGDESMCINLVINFDNMIFETAGKYLIRIEIEDKSQEVPIYVNMNKEKIDV